MTIAQSPRSDNFPAEITALRQQLRRNGLEPLPAYGEKPVIKGWPHDDKQIHPRLVEARKRWDDGEIQLWAQWHHDATNTVFDAKFAPAVLIDSNNEAAAEAAEKVVRKYFEKRGDIYVCLHWPTKRLIPLRTDEPFPKLSRTLFSPNDDEHQIKLLGDGQMYVVDGDVDGHPARWLGGDLRTIQHKSLPDTRHEDGTQLLDAIAKVWVEKFGFVLETPATRMQWMLNNCRKAEARVEAHKAANPEPTPKTLQEIRKLMVGLKENNKKLTFTIDNVTHFLDRKLIVGLLKKKELNFTVDDIIAVLDIFSFDQIADWRDRLRHHIEIIWAELNPDESKLPPDTLREIQNPGSKRLWNVMMVLKDKGYTINSSIALIEKYPTGMAAKYRGRLRHEVEKIWAKLDKGKGPKPTEPIETDDEKEKPAAAPVGPPLPIDETIKVFQRWLLLKDDTPVYAVLGTIAANYLEGDPVWFGVIGPPSSAKTEILNATSMLPHVVQAATLTVAGLLSGTPKRQQTAGAKGGLLQQIGEFGIIVLKDFGSILSMHTETRAEVLAALREIYDGAWTRHIGSDGGRTLSWKGKVGLVFAATEVIDSHYAVIGAMGDRFLLSRLAPTPGQPQFKRALAHLGGTTKQMRKELAEAIAKLFAGRRPQPQPISNDEANFIGEVISLAVRLRGAVERDRRTREIDAIYGAEGTARIGLALERLLAGLDTLGVDRAKALAIVKRVALDSVPPLRRRAYECVCKHDPVETADVAIELGLPTNTARRILEDLAAHGLVIRRSQGQGKADLWERANWEAEDKKAEEKLNSRSQKEDEEPDRSGAVYALQGMKQPETVPCAYCGQTGDVYQFADGRLPKDRRQYSALHAGCAEAFFTGLPG
jgi:hypothetical protein